MFLINLYEYSIIADSLLEINTQIGASDGKSGTHYLITINEIMSFPLHLQHGKFVTQDRLARDRRIDDLLEIIAEER
jgi:hypothetical protein